MPIFSIDVRIAATAYIRAASAAEALAAAKALECTCLALPDGMHGDIAVSGRQYDDPRLPDLSLSPAMTCWGPADDATPEPVDDTDPQHPGAIVRANLEA